MDLDITLIGQLLLLLLLMVVLSKLLFSPLLEVLDKRFTKTTLLLKQAELLDKLSADDLERYQHHLRQLKAAAFKEYVTALSEAQQASRERLKVKQEQVVQELQNERKLLAAAEQGALEALQGQVAELSGALRARLTKGELELLVGKALPKGSRP